tara:strand:- start:160 stop:450 length:291 start_codon:yes stop_codon:yes gene_type:complete
MKIKNFTIYFFAIIGFVVIACSAAATTESIDDDPVDNPPVVQSNIGKYQISLTMGSSSYMYMTSVNTETGVSKTYQKRANITRWEEWPLAAITFTH